MKPQFADPGVVAAGGNSAGKLLARSATNTQKKRFSQPHRTVTNRAKTVTNCPFSCHKTGEKLSLSGLQLSHKCPKDGRLAHPVWYVPHMKHTTTCNTPKTRSVTLSLKTFSQKTRFRNPAERPKNENGPGRKIRSGPV